MTHSFLTRALLGVTLAGLALTLTACQTSSSQNTAAATVEKPLVASSYVDGNGKTGIQGQVTIKDDGQAMQGGYVNIYPDTISNLLGPSQFISLPTGADGRYSLDAPPGVYYVVARKRMSGQPTGPLAPGDFYSEHQRIVTTVIEGKISQINLEVVPMKAPMFFKTRVVDRETATGIRGVLVDQTGKPVMGGFAMAYSDPDLKRLPDYASTLSNEQGSFTIYLPQGGTFYLAARIHAWDMPSPGEPYGKFGGDPPTAVVVANDTFVEEIKIEMRPFTGSYTPGKSRRPF